MIEEVFNLINDKNSFITNLNNNKIEELYYVINNYVKNNYLDYEEVFVVK